MYGKEIDSNTIQKGGGNVEAGVTAPRPAEPQQDIRLQTNINKIIMKKGIFESTFDRFQNLFNKSKLLRILFMVFFYMFFYEILLNIFTFFDVDSIYSYTYTLWLTIVITLYAFLPMKKSYLSNKNNNTISFEQASLFVTTIIAIISSIFIAIFHKY
jgi:hypothetical protein